MDLYALSQYLAQKELVGKADREITGYCIDSRQVKPGQLFFALPGQRVDGHQFVADALAKGAAGAVVTRVPPGVESFFGQAGLLVVPDVLEALQAMAAGVRLAAGIPLVAVTGSNGKTTTKDLIATVLAGRYRTLKTEGNFNNELGLPLTLLSLTEHYQVGVVEMGMRGLGQIRELCRIARPDYGVITNIGTAHYELLGSRENIARAKGELLESLPDEGAAILNRDDAWSFRLGEELKRKRPRLRVLYYGFHGEAEIRASQPEPAGDGSVFRVTGQGKSLQAYLPLPGAHNVQNGLAALAAGLVCGVPLEEGVDSLARAVISEKRLARVAGIRNTTIIDDTYNANPDSVIASLEVLAGLPGGRKIAVLGTQRELGPLAEEGHRKVGATVAKLGIDFLVTVGREARWMAEEALAGGMEERQVRSVEHNGEAILLLQQMLQPGDLVLVKGSRALTMEEIVRALTA